MGPTFFDALTFDCYGTLIDWESGILAAWKRLTRNGNFSPDAVLESFARQEARQEHETPDMAYPELLAQVFLAMARDFGFEPAREDALSFGRSVPEWPAFPDSADALERLARHCRLFVLSNIDRASFAASNERLGGRFDAVLTAQDTGVYKPDPAGFKALIATVEEYKIPRSRILHVAQSLYHDHVPAKAAGLATCWIDRRGKREGAGATMTPDEDVRPDFHFVSMGEFVDAFEKEC